MTATLHWVTDNRLKLADLERHLGSLDRDDSYLGEYRVMATSGSTGRPKGVVKGAARSIQ